MKICPVVAELFHADGRTDRHTDMTKPIVTFSNFANAPKKEKILYKLYICPATVFRNISGKTVHVIG